MGTISIGPPTIHRQVGQPVVFRFATARADHHLPARVAREAQGLRGLRQRANLVDLQQQRIGAFPGDGAADSLRVRA